MTKQKVSRQESFGYRSLQDAVDFAKSNNIELSDITLEANDVSEYGGSDYTACLVYKTLETDKEYLARLERDQYYKELVETRERQEYERLQKIFGPK